MDKPARDILVDAAFEAFLAKGYAGAGISDIIAGTGLSRGAIYHHFGNKLGLFAAVVARYLPFAFDAVEWAARAGMSVADQHAAIGRMYATASEAESRYADRLDRYYALFFDALSHLPAFRRSVSQGYARTIDALTAAERREGAKDAGAAERRARAFMAGIEGDIYLRAVMRSDERNRS